jgi:hypothetical protein
VLSVFPAGRGGEGEPLHRDCFFLRHGCQSCSWCCGVFIKLLLAAMEVAVGAAAGVSAMSSPS